MGEAPQCSAELVGVQYKGALNVPNVQPETRNIATQQSRSASQHVQIKQCTQSVHKKPLEVQPLDGVKSDNRQLWCTSCRWRLAPGGRTAFSICLKYSLASGLASMLVTAWAWRQWILKPTSTSPKLTQPVHPKCPSYTTGKL